MQNKYTPRPEQSIALLKALHILTLDGKLNQDSRRKLKQVQHLLGFIAPLLLQTAQTHGSVHVVDHGAGKSYLGFMLYDAFFKSQLPNRLLGSVTGVETRADLVERSAQLARDFDFVDMRFIHASVKQMQSQAELVQQLPPRIDIVTALHACDTATDDAIDFALVHQTQHVVLVPCCQAEVAACLRSAKPSTSTANPWIELWRRPLHTREFGAHLTNVLRCLRLEAHGYQVKATELVGWEHSMKNELILASKTATPHQASQATTAAKARLQEILGSTGLAALLQARFQAA